MARRREGDWFAVALGEAGYAVRLVARAPKRGNVVFGELRASADEIEATLTALAERHGDECDGREWALPS